MGKEDASETQEDEAEFHGWKQTGREKAGVIRSCWQIIRRREVQSKEHEKGKV